MMTNFVLWLAIVLRVTFAGYAGVVYVTPMAWLIADGKIVKHWGEENGVTVLTQLGFNIKLEPIEKQQ